MKINMVIADKCDFVSVMQANWNRDGQTIVQDYISVVIGSDSSSDVGKLMCTSGAAQLFKDIPKYSSVQLYGVFDTFKKELYVSAFDVLPDKDVIG